MTETKEIEVRLDKIPYHDHEKIKNFIQFNTRRISSLLLNNEVVTLQTKGGNKYYLERFEEEDFTKLLNGDKNPTTVGIAVTQIDRVDEDLTMTVNVEYNMRAKSEIDGSPLSTRAKNALKRLNITKFEEIQDLNNLSALRNVGVRTVAEIKGYMIRHGMKDKTAINRTDTRFTRSITEEELRRRHENRATNAPHQWYKNHGIEEPEWSKKCFHAYSYEKQLLKLSNF